MKRFFEIILMFPRSSIIVILLFTAFMAYQLPPKFESDWDRLMPQDHPVIVYDNVMEEIFGIEDVLVVGISNRGKDGIFNRKSLRLIARLTEKIQGIEGVISYKDDDVKSLSTIDNIVGTEEGMEVKPLMEMVPTSEEGIRKLRQAVYDNEMFIKWIVSEDGTAAVILAEVEEDVNRVFVYEQLRDILDKEKNDTEKTYIGGLPVVECFFTLFSAKDMKVMFPLVILTVMVVLFITLKSFRGVFLPILIVIFSSICSLGVMALCHISMDTFSFIIPIVLIAIGVADGIHILSKYYDEGFEMGDGNRREIVMNTMMEMWPPVVMTSLTTAAGFLSLATSELIPMQNFGIFTAVGIIAAMIFSLIFIPASLMLMKVKIPLKVKGKTDSRKDLKLTGITAYILAWLGRYVYIRRNRVVMVALGIIGVSIIGLSQVYIDSSTVSNFDEGTIVRDGDEFLNDKFGGTNMLYIIIEAEENDAIMAPAMLRGIDGLQTHLERLQEVGASISMAEYIKRMNRVMNENRKDFYTVPLSSNLTAQYLFLYSLSGDPDDFEEVVDYNYRKANIHVQIKEDRTQIFKKVVANINSYISSNFPRDKVKINLSGAAVLDFVFDDLLIKGQVWSIITSIIAVFFITAAMFRSFTAGLFNIVPITVATLFNFGIMGLLGIPLKVPTALISSIGIGVGIDYTIHFISKYRLVISTAGDIKESTVLTMITSGRAIFFNALVVIMGFLVLLMSNFPMNRVMGSLVALNMFTSFVGAITILPALLNIVKPRFIHASL